MPLLPPVTVDGLTVRELPSSEWGKLASAGGMLAGAHLPADSSARILVAEDASGRLCGYWVVAAMVHLEPLWLAPDVRHRAHFLLAWIGAVCEILRQEGIQFVFAVTGTPENAQMAEALGLKEIPGRLYGGLLAEGQ